PGLVKPPTACPFLVKRGATGRNDAMASLARRVDAWWRPLTRSIRLRDDRSMRKLCYGAILIAAVVTACRESSQPAQASPTSPPAPIAPPTATPDGRLSEMRLACEHASAAEQRLADYTISKGGESDELSLDLTKEASAAEGKCQELAMHIPAKFDP